MTNIVFERPVLTVRIHAGLNAASFLAGLLSVASPAELLDADELLHARFPNTKAHLVHAPHSVNGIAGSICRFEGLNEAEHDHGQDHHHHVHRTCAEIEAIYDNEGKLSPAARELASSIWSVLARAEARVHGAAPEDVHFHEVGRMENILAVGLIAEVFAAINPIDFVASPVPLTDGEVHCAHGVVPNPAPALLAMLDGVAVGPFAGEGEAVTPTGLAVVLGLGPRFGRWPSMRVARHATAFHAAKVFAERPNGLIFALGEALEG